MLKNVFILRRNYHFYSGCIVAIHHILLCKHVSGRYCHCAKAMQRGVGYPILRSALHYEHYKIAFAYTHFVKGSRKLFGKTGYLAEGKLLFLSLIVAPHKRPFFRAEPCVFVHYVKCKIKFFRDPEL